MQSSKIPIRKGRSVLGNTSNFDRSATKRRRLHSEGVYPYRKIGFFEPEAELEHEPKRERREASNVQTFKETE